MALTSIKFEYLLPVETVKYHVLNLNTAQVDYRSKTLTTSVCATPGVSSGGSMRLGLTSHRYSRDHTTALQLQKRQDI